jgi:hypothetical protein
MNLVTLYKRAIALLAAAPKSAADQNRHAGPRLAPSGTQSLGPKWGLLIVPQHSRVFRMHWTPPQSAPESALWREAAATSAHHPSADV